VVFNGLAELLRHSRSDWLVFAARLPAFPQLTWRRAAPSAKGPFPIAPTRRGRQGALQPCPAPLMFGGGNG
jgi:hypothetical protein